MYVVDGLSMRPDWLLAQQLKTFSSKETEFYHAVILRLVDEEAVLVITGGKIGIIHHVNLPARKIGQLQQ